LAKDFYGAEEDHHDDQHTGQVLGAAISVGIAIVARAARQRECDPQRDRRQRVGEVVNRVGQQRHTAADRHDDHLKQRRRQERDQRDFHRPDAARIGHGRIERAGVMAVLMRLNNSAANLSGRVRVQVRGHGGDHRARSVVLMIVAVIMSMVFSMLIVTHHPSITPALHQTQCGASVTSAVPQHAFALLGIFTNHYNSSSTGLRHDFHRATTRLAPSTCCSRWPACWVFIVSNL
jgi:hypothetical protein